MNKDFLRETLVQNGFDYQELVNNIRRKVEETDSLKLDGRSKKRFQIIKLNYQRYLRIQKTFKVSDALKKIIAAINKPQLWLIITEESCGDSAQTIPCIYNISQMNPKITLRFLYRDENVEIMDRFLTNGKRRIPKLIAFDKEGNEMFQWGPRPGEADKLFYHIRDDEGRGKDAALEKVHLWFGKDRCKSFNQEFFDLLTQKKLLIRN